MLSEQVPDQDHGASMVNWEQVNDHIEQDYHTDNVVEDDGTNTLIHDSFNVRMDDEDDNDNEILMTLMMFTIYLFSIRHTNPFMKAPKQIFSLLYCW